MKEEVFMILTLDEDKKNIIFNELIPKEGSIKDIEELNHLYSTVNFEYGYLQHGMLWFRKEKPDDTEIRENNIVFYDEYTWGRNGLGGHYPVNYFTTKAKNTLIIVRKLLKLNKGGNFNMSSFFEDNPEIAIPSEILINEKFDLSLQIKKLEYILKNEELALSILKDAYLDFYLFVRLLDKIEFKQSVINNPGLFKSAYDGALENTQILSLSKKFSELI